MKLKFKKNQQNLIYFKIISTKWNFFRQIDVNCPKLLGQVKTTTTARLFFFFQLFNKSRWLIWTKFQTIKSNDCDLRFHHGTSTTASKTTSPTEQTTESVLRWPDPETTDSKSREIQASRARSGTWTSGFTSYSIMDQTAFVSILLFYFLFHFQRFHSNWQKCEKWEYGAQHNIAIQYGY